MFRNSAACSRACCTSWRESANRPVVHIPMPRVTLCMCVTLLASSSLSGTFFWVTTHTQSAPRTASDVRATLFTALKAYSTWNSRPSGEKMVMCLS